MENGCKVITGSRRGGTKEKGSRLAEFHCVKALNIHKKKEKVCFARAMCILFMDDELCYYCFK